MAPQEIVSHPDPNHPPPTQDTTRGGSHVPVLRLPTRVKTVLVGTFVYPAGMDVRAPDMDVFLQEVHAHFLLHSCSGVAFCVG